MTRFREKLLRAILDMIVLKIVAEESVHGYKIISAIKERLQLYHFGSSTIYQKLNDLEKEGYIHLELVMRGKTGRLCKQYTITEEGKARLSQTQAELKTIIDFLGSNEATCSCGDAKRTGECA
jgi:DNA-binding PadR family transcriptional regulator